MASIRKRNGKWHVQVRRKGFAPVSRSFHQKIDAEQWARHMEVKADRGELLMPQKVLDKHTVKSILERYKREISSKKLS
jgi:acetolactate synthase regulatory subunit